MEMFMKKKNSASFTVAVFCFGAVVGTITTMGSAYFHRSAKIDELVQAYRDGIDSNTKLKNAFCEAFRQNKFDVLPGYEKPVNEICMER